jgi:hypothetical protein
VVVALAVAALTGLPARADTPPTSPCSESIPSGGNCPQLSETTPVEGQQLTATLGVWSGDPAPALAIQWQQCTSVSASSCASIDGETETSFVVPKTFGVRYRVLVVATNSAGSMVRTSLVSGEVGANPGNYPGQVQRFAPVLSVVSGDAMAPQEGDRFRGLEGTTPEVPNRDGWFNPPAMVIQFSWRRCLPDGTGCVTIPGATAQEYTAVGADAGHALRVRVTGSNANGATQLSSMPSAPVRALPPVPAPQLRLTGKKKQRLGKTVDVTVSTDRATNATAGGTLFVSVPSGRIAKVKQFKLRSVLVQLAVGPGQVVKLGLSKKARRAAKAALRGGRKVRAEVVVTVAGVGLRRTVKLKPPAH